MVYLIAIGHECGIYPVRDCFWPAPFGNIFFIYSWMKIIIFSFKKSIFTFFWQTPSLLENHSTVISFLFVPCIVVFCVFFFFLLLFCFIKIQGVKHAEYIARAKYLLGV